ncbi:hypothetical protein SUGI_1228610 [Cryptomeria japonica]|uniref:Uncharacterized protein n=1 Tax=Cryptomeria japonica TaxID=3369 RepID=A0AAD3NQ36_CRYJA|nr:hypothetical protein SUGI_1228610 [Cryptomeria japonica]
MLALPPPIMTRDVATGCAPVGSRPAADGGDAASLDAAGSQNGIGTVTVSYGSPMGSRKEQNQGPQSLCLSMREEPIE